MRKVIVDPALKVKLHGLNEQVELCDENGQTLGHFLPLQTYHKLVYAAVAAACPFSEEELQRRERETGARSLAEIWKRLEKA
jgi:hypothetical protein